MSVGAPQQILSGKYRLERELGRGGMGSVWLAQHLTLRSPVAIKLIDPGIASNPEALARFLREAQAAASLRSPHVVQILDHGVDEGVPFIVMELLEGESLASRIEREHRLSPVDTARIVTQVARAISRAHEAGIVHRDLKPDNIYLVRNDEEEVAKVLDFGVAKATSHGMGSVSGATRTGSVLGTPYYMSPEQAEGAKTVDGRSDLWSLGVIAWECLLGNRPFESETLGGLLLAICARPMPVPSSMGPLPPGFDAWFARACSRDLSQRFGSAKELAHELRVVCGVAGGAPMPMGYAAGPVSSAQGAVVQAASLPLASTTAHLGMSSSNGEPAKKKSAAPVVALVAGVLLLGGVGAFFALRGGGDDTVASAVPPSPTPPVEQKPAAAAPPVAQPPEPAAPTPTASATPVASPSPAAPAAPAVRRPAAKPQAAKPTTKPAENPAEKPAAAPAPAPATTKPRVNLGI